MLCDSPYDVPNPKFIHVPGATSTVPVPCGRCVNCQKKRINQWVFRLRQQEKVSISSHFVTLTYESKYLTRTPNNFRTLVKKDLQDFFKRLRYYHYLDGQEEKIKYYAVGEYGSKRYRPHYHIILFNAAPRHISSAWTFGDIDIGTVTSASIAYTCKYISKRKRIPLHNKDDRLKEFSVMSKGLGSNYLSDSVIKYHRADLERNFVLLEDGIKVALPKYYRDRIYTDTELAAQRSIIVSKLEKANALDEAVFYRKKGANANYFKYLDDQKVGRDLSFYNSFNNRGL